MLDIYIDGDGCAVKDETYRVAERFQLKVFVVANKWMSVPSDSRVEMVVVSGGFDAADDWIVEHGSKGDIVVTSDILLADRCVKKQMAVLGPKGVEFTEDSIGGAVANRELMQNLRHMGEMRGGPAPMEKKDRSQFLGKLDQIIQRLRRENG
ncbi:MAG TPA: YaiI/YqxD family protein [Bdellovibrionales bacterium]|nr:YaiI/YqxD family protein [Bdellovibrionales bacterium]